jgi:hypothetical protein
MKTAIAHLKAQEQTLLHNAAVFHREGRTQERDTALDDANDIAEALMVLESRTPVLVEKVLPEPSIGREETPRTVKEWLATIPESEAALRHMDPRNSEFYTPSAHRALLRAFDWSKAPERYDFWSAVYDRLQRESPLETLGEPKELGPIGKTKLVKEKPRTVKEWLAMIPESEAALRNMDPRNSEFCIPSAQRALARAFRWSGTPEGFNYWSAVYNRLEREYLTPSSENITLPV